MQIKRIIIAISIATTIPAMAAQTDVPEPNSPVKTETKPSTETLNEKPNDYPIFDPDESVFYWPARAAERYKSFSSPECESAFTAYHRFFETMFPEPDSLLNECALGPLIDMNKLMGFDPIGGILNAIKGAMCGFIKNEIHDPFINSINKPMSKANQWINSTNQSYSDFIDQETRNLQQSIYDPHRHYDKSGLKFPDSLPPPNANPGGQQAQPPVATVPEQETPEEREERIKGEILDSGGGISETVIDSDGNETDYFYTAPEVNNDWTEIYNIYNQN